MRDDLLRRVERLEAGLREREEQWFHRLLRALDEVQLLELEEALAAGGDVDALLARFRSDLASGREPRRRARFLRSPPPERVSAPPVTSGSRGVPEASPPSPRSTEGAGEPPVVSPAAVEVEDPRYARRSPVDGTPINEGVTMVRASGRPAAQEKLFEL